MFKRICKLFICLGALFFLSSCTSHRTYYVSEEYVESRPHIVVEEPVVIIHREPRYVYEFGPPREFIFMERQWFGRRECYAPRRHSRPRYYAPRHSCERRSEVQVGVGFGFHSFSGF